MGTLEYWSCMPCIFWVQVLFTQLYLALTRSSAAHVQAARSYKLPSQNKSCPPAALLLQRWERCWLGSTLWGVYHGGTWSNRTYAALALSSLLATCVVFWSHRRRDIGYTAVMFSPERMYITLDSGACTSYPSLKRYKCIWRLAKLLAFMNWVHFFFHNNFSLLITDSKVELQKNLQWSYIYLC
jgi:hypothetical protein